MGLKTQSPISYYGGKSNMIPHILPLLRYNGTEQYVELFGGGLTVLFSKKPHKKEVVNDYDLRVATFWEACRDNFEPLQEEIQNTLHHEHYYTKADHILKNFGEYSQMWQAWAFWVQTQMSFSCQIAGGFAFDNSHKTILKMLNKRRNFNYWIKQRLLGIEILCRDANNVIDLKDAENTFFYADPPYPSSDCGHYKGYTMEHYTTLLNRLAVAKGKFLLSSYPEPVLMEYIQKYGWHYKAIEQPIAVNGAQNKGKIKTEMLVYNYKIDKTQTLF